MSTEFSNETLEKDSSNTGLQIVKESEEDRLMTLSVGPQHPGSGHFRFTVKVDGDYIEEKKRCVNTATLFRIFLTSNDRLYTILTT
jgi:hypothetical protein